MESNWIYISTPSDDHDLLGYIWKHENYHIRVIIVDGDGPDRHMVGRPIRLMRARPYLYTNHYMTPEDELLALVKYGELIERGIKRCCLD